MTARVRDRLFVAYFAAMALLSVATLAALLAREAGLLPASRARVNASEPMAVSTLPDGSKLCTYVHVDPDTGRQLYVTSAGGIWPRDAPTPGGRDVTVYDRADDDAADAVGTNVTAVGTNAN